MIIKKKKNLDVKQIYFSTIWLREMATFTALKALILPYFLIYRLKLHLSLKKLKNEDKYLTDQAAETNYR